MLALYAFDENIKLSAEKIQLRLQIAVDRFIGQRSGLKESFQMVDRFVARGVGEDKKANEFLFVTPPSVPFDDV